MKTRVTILVSFLFCVCVAYGALSTPFCKNHLLLADIKSTPIGRFVCPPGKRFSLVLAVEVGYGIPITGPCTFTVRSNNNDVQQGTLDPADLEATNWLDRQGRSGYVLKFDDPNHLLNLRPGAAYDITIRCDKLADTNVSLWLCYVTTHFAQMKGD